MRYQNCISELIKKELDVIKRSYFMSVEYCRLNGPTLFASTTADITSFFPKESNLVKSVLVEALKKPMKESSPTKVIDAQVQIIAFNRI